MKNILGNTIKSKIDADSVSNVLSSIGIENTIYTIVFDSKDNYISIIFSNKQIANMAKNELSRCSEAGKLNDYSVSLDRSDKSRNTVKIAK